MGLRAPDCKTSPRETVAAHPVSPSRATRQETGEPDTRHEDNGTVITAH